VSHTSLSDCTKASGGFEAYEANTPVGQIASEDGFVVHAMVPTMPKEPNTEFPHSLQKLEVLKGQSLDKKKDTEQVIFKSQDSEQG
jgi:hypothetical protein